MGAIIKKYSMKLHCSFCRQEFVNTSDLVSGSNTYICRSCLDILHDEFKKRDEEIKMGEGFRLAMRGADGTVEKHEYISFNRVQCLPVQCFQCRTWNVGDGVIWCLHCGAQLSKHKPQL